MEVEDSPPNASASLPASIYACLSIRSRNSGGNIIIVSLRAKIKNGTTQAEKECRPVDRDGM
jgi:hypothetical protein